MVEALTIQQRGGHARAARLPAERRREIAIAASRSALLKRKGLPTKRALAKLYLEELKRRNPDLARLIEVGMKFPECYDDRMQAMLTAEDWGYVIEAYSIAESRWHAQQKTPEAKQ
jgi:hypothetical protein